MEVSKFNSARSSQNIRVYSYEQYCIFGSQLRHFTIYYVKMSRDILGNNPIAKARATKFTTLSASLMYRSK